MSGSRRSPAPLSIGLFTYATLPRGSVVHAAAVAEALHDAGCDVTLYALDKEARGFYRPLRVPLRLVPAGPAPASTPALVAQRAGELASFLARERPLHDIFHAQDCLTSQALLAHRRVDAGVRFVRTLHHVEAFEDEVLAQCQRRSVVEAELCLTVSKASQRACAETFGVRSTLVGNGVDLVRFQGAREEVRRSRPARTGGGAPTLLAVGGVEERKNTLGILHAFAELHVKGEAAALRILGGATVLDHGRYRAAFVEALAALPAPTRAAVREDGIVPADEMARAIAGADVLVMPSLHEGFGLVALEALAAGVPVVASRRAPFTEFLDDGAAVLVDPTSPAEIAAGVREAWSSPLRGGRTLRGLAIASHHGWDAVAARHLAAYASLCEGALAGTTTGTTAGAFTDALLRSLSSTPEVHHA